MPLQLTPGSTSRSLTRSRSRGSISTLTRSASSPLRITKPTTTTLPTLRRSSSTTSTTSTRKLPIPLPLATPIPTRPPLPLTALLYPPNLSPPSSDPLETITYITTHLFTPLPLSSPLFSPQTIASTLSLRQSVPKIVPLSVLSAFSPLTGTELERQLAALVAQGKVRRVPLPGSSSGRRGEDGYVLWSEMEAAVRERMGVGGEGETVAREFLDMLRRQPEAVTVNTGALSRGTLQRALEAGFVTLPLGRGADGTEQEYPLTMPSLGPLMRCLAAASERVVEIIQRHGVAHAGPSSSVVIPLPLLRERYDPLLRNPQATAELFAEAEGAAGGFVAGGGDGGAGRQSKAGGRTRAWAKRWIKSGGMGVEVALAELLGGNARGRAEAVWVGCGGGGDGGVGGGSWEGTGVRWRK
ncbi:hypothetical protein BDZ91DRAFT_850241 [Kalaharituber pfeilii]|nr:hypothetical protein BDZ91DRAFT_850241 [Kalaharituber pfeilii]